MDTVKWRTPVLDRVAGSRLVLVLLGVLAPTRSDTALRAASGTSIVVSRAQRR
jgi:hypothetical protein